MGILDDVLGAAIGAAQGGRAAAAPAQSAAMAGGAGLQGLLLQQLVSMLAGRQGGLGGLLQSLQQQGMGDIAKSWISTGQNLPISAAQVTQILGSGQISELARKVGMPQADTASALTQLLPNLIDKLTPQGQLPQQDPLAGLMGLARQMMGGR